MEEAETRGRIWAITAVAIVAAIGVASLYLRIASPVSRLVIVEFLVVYALLAVAGTVVIARPTNLSGWCLFLLVTVGVVEGFGYVYGLYPGLPTSGSLPLARPAVLMALSLQPLKRALVPPLFLAFPSGPLDRRRAKIAAAAMVVPVAATALVLLTPDAPYGGTELAVRVAARTYGAAAEPAFRFVWFMFQAFTIGCAAWVLFNLRRGDAVVRQQGRWLLGGAIVMLGLELTNAVFLERVNSPIQFWLWNGAIMFFAICTGVAVTKYRLFDIDLLVSKAVLYASLAAVIATVYTGLVGVLGYLVSASSSSFALSVAGATGAALVLFPLQERLRRYANLLVFGRRATPYEAMSSFSRALRDALGHDQSCPPSPAQWNAGPEPSGSRWRHSCRAPKRQSSSVALPDRRTRRSTSPSPATRSGGSRFASGVATLSPPPNGSSSKISLFTPVLP